MLSFLKAAGILLVLIVIGAFISDHDRSAGALLGLLITALAVLAIFRPRPNIGLGHRGFSFCMALLVGFPMMNLGVPTPEGTSSSSIATVEADPAPGAAVAATPTATAEAPREAVQGLDDLDAAMSARSAAEQAEIEKLMGQVDREIASIPTISAARYRESMVRVNAGLLLTGTWGLLYEQASALDLTDEQRQKLSRFRTMAADKQAEMLPAMRDAYGPIMRRELWEADGKARTTGSGYRTITFTMPAFARNANIKEAHEMMREVLMMLRFTRAEYKWIDHGEYSFYTLEPPADRDIVRWENGGRFRVLN